MVIKGTQVGRSAAPCPESARVDRPLRPGRSQQPPALIATATCHGDQLPTTAPSRRRAAAATAPTAETASASADPATANTPGIGGPLHVYDVLTLSSHKEGQPHRIALKITLTVDVAAPSPRPHPECRSTAASRWNHFRRRSSIGFAVPTAYCF